MKPLHTRPGLAATCAALLLTCASMGMAQAQAAAGPDAVELEFWKAATLINTPDSYRAYLAKYPSGAFAELARAGAGKGAAPAATSSAAPISAPAPTQGLAVLKPDLAALKRLPRHSTAVDFGPGTVFNGPGFVTAGHWGAKRQLVVPRGTWAVMAVRNHELKGPYEVELTTVALLRTDAEAPGTALFITFNRRSPPQVPATWTSQIPRWEALDSCLSRSVSSLVQAPASDMRLQWCTAYRTEAELPRQSQLAVAIQADWLAGLQTAGVAPPEHQVSVEAHVQDKQNQFTSYLLRQRAGLGVRLLSPVQPEPYGPLPASLSAPQRAEAAQGMHLALTAARAHQRSYERFELVPDAPATSPEALERVLSQVE